MEESQTGLVLASGSGIRKRLLSAAGFQFEVDPADIDERAIEKTISDPAVLAAKLAEEKALTVSRRHPNRLVLGSDQVFTLAGKYVAKPENTSDLITKLTSLSGRTHEFNCGFALVRDGVVLHSEVDSVRVSFYDLSDQEVVAYAQTGEGLGCAGGYRFEEGGVRLIREVEGSHFTVLGLPMTPLVRWLRESGEIEGLMAVQENSNE
ncbi:MAG: septum formation protein [Planctomycetota bacterium]|jgi:septum formation protein